MNRRHFLVSASAAASQSWAGANDRVRVAVVGVGSRGSAHIREILPVANMEVAALVDPDGQRTEAAASVVFKKTGKTPRIESDMRRIFDSKEIDAVTIATTNHWHTLTAIWAMQAGKDVYVEKPCSHNVHEGRVMTQWARKLGRMCQMGVQSRSMTGMRDALDFIHSGKIGDVKFARAICYRLRNSIGLVDTPAPVPEGLDL
ncbi:MAG: Gfo/Idh/MocA family oxidoreductase, partial [Bryobacterales bacterium]|nr:Gfo/Idh/MocA family oxidoreductase [Bryobacterales bacterium]